LAKSSYLLDKSHGDEGVAGIFTDVVYVADVGVV